MKSFLLEMPEDPTKLREWLTERIISGKLGYLTTELAANNGTPLCPMEFENFIDNNLMEEILRKGLICLTDEQITLMLRQPLLLLELQDRIFLAMRHNGDGLWETAFREATETQESMKRALQELSDAS